MALISRAVRPSFCRNPLRCTRGQALSDPICPLCLRPIPAEAKQSLHHLIPRLKGGKGGPVVLLHQVCHSEIHARFTEAELARTLNTVEALRAHPDLAGFLHWVAKRPPAFHSRSTGGRRKRGRRR